MWNKFETALPVHETLSIIDDALCYLFEFKVENHQLYFREITTVE